ncbi:hypothetical protein ElyMa_004670900 [Elysia marginata]|uniref:Uncharacterized protein n=1 Tax=Elysia marginata TaxID=1093978 RepID=A0AAV4I5X1_9GAST|nr:hypothetical protein ElyMa_004670900 [Elysia marginata]
MSVVTHRRHDLSGNLSRDRQAKIIKLGPSNTLVQKPISKKDEPVPTTAASFAATTTTNIILNSMNSENNNNNIHHHMNDDDSIPLVTQQPQLSVDGVLSPVPGNTNNSLQLQQQQNAQDDDEDDGEEDNEDDGGQNTGDKSELPLDSQGYPAKKTVAQIMKDKKRQTQLTLQW